MIFYIKKPALEAILQASRTSYPMEFGAMLRGKEDTITEALLLPGTIQGSKHALFNLNMLPTKSRSIGSVHSHPSLSNNPSQADLFFFRKTGRVHLIAAYPYRNITNIAAYSNDGNPVELEVIE